MARLSATRVLYAGILSGSAVLLTNSVVKARFTQGRNTTVLPRKLQFPEHGGMCLIYVNSKLRDISGTIDLAKMTWYFRAEGGWQKIVCQHCWR